MALISIEELKNSYRREKNGEVRERILMILWLKSGLSSYEVAKRLFCPQSKVMYWKKRFDESGLDGLKTIPKQGRPPSIEKRIEIEIKQELSSMSSWRTSHIAGMIREKSGIVYTRRHVTRLMHRWGYSLITPRKKHRNSASPEDVAEFKKKQQRYWVLSGRE